MPKRVTVLLEDDEYAQVRKSAGLIPLSRWFKSLALQSLILGVVPKRESRAEDNPAQDLPRVGSVPAPERRAGVAKSISASRATRGKEREIKLCRHNLAECTICGVSA